MRSFVFTLGFHEDFILRRLSGKAAQREERILVFTASPAVAAVRRAFASLLEYCERLGLSRPECVELDLRSTAAALLTARRAVLGLEAPIVADIGGGPRPLGAVVLLALLTSGVDFELYVTGETGEGWEVHVPLGVSRALRGLSEEKVSILRVIGEVPGISAEGVARRLGKSLKTVRNHLWELKRMGLVASRGRGAPLSLTSWGAALAEFPGPSREQAAPSREHGI